MVTINLKDVKLNAKASVENVTEKVLLPEDSYEAEIIEVGNIFSSTFRGGDKDVTKDKVPITFAVEVKEGETKNIPMYPTAVVTPAGGKYSASKMYDLINTAGLMKDLEQEAALWTSFEGSSEEQKTKQDEAFVQFLKDRLLNKKCKVMLKTANKNNPDAESYSVVDRIPRML